MPWRKWQSGWSRGRRSTRSTGTSLISSSGRTLRPSPCSRNWPRWDNGTNRGRKGAPTMTMQRGERVLVTPRSLQPQTGNHHPVVERLVDRGFQVAYPRSTRDRKSTRLNSSHVRISYAVFCLKKKKERLGYTTL